MVVIFGVLVILVVGSMLLFDVMIVVLLGICFDFNGLMMRCGLFGLNGLLNLIGFIGVRIYLGRLDGNKVFYVLVIEW